MYATLKPEEAYNGRSSNFGMANNKETKCLTKSRNSDFTALRENMIYFLDLKVKLLYMNVLKIPVAYEINKVDPENKMLEFTYLSNNLSNGRQSVRFEELPNGKTKIIHDTWFKSLNKKRYKYLYKPVHKNLVNKFHKDVIKKLKQKKKESKS